MCFLRVSSYLFLSCFCRRHQYALYRRSRNMFIGNHQRLPQIQHQWLSHSHDKCRWQLSRTQNLGICPLITAVKKHPKGHNQEGFKSILDHISVQFCFFYILGTVYATYVLQTYVCMLYVYIYIYAVNVKKFLLTISECPLRCLPEDIGRISNLWS